MDACSLQSSLEKVLKGADNISLLEIKNILFCAGSVVWALTVHANLGRDFLWESKSMLKFSD